MTCCGKLGRKISGLISFVVWNGYSIPFGNFLYLAICSSPKNNPMGLFLGEEQIARYRKLPNGILYPFHTTKEISPDIFLPNLPQQVNSISQTEQKISSPLSIVSTKSTPTNASITKITSPFPDEESIPNEESFVVSTPRC